MNIMAMSFNLGQLHLPGRTDRSCGDPEHSGVDQSWVRFTCAHRAAKDLAFVSPHDRNAHRPCDHELVDWISRRLERLDLSMQEMALACEALRCEPLPQKQTDSLRVCLRVSLVAISAGSGFRQHAPWQLLASTESHLVRVYLRSATNVAVKLAWVRKRVATAAASDPQLKVIDQVRSQVKAEIECWASVCRRPHGSAKNWAQSAQQQDSTLNTLAFKPKTLSTNACRVSFKEAGDVCLNDADITTGKPTRSSLARLIQSALDIPFAVHRPPANAHAECTYAI